MSLDEGYVRYIENGPNVPVKTFGGVATDDTISEDIIVPKLFSEYTSKKLNRCTKMKRP